MHGVAIRIVSGMACAAAPIGATAAEPHYLAAMSVTDLRAGAGLAMGMPPVTGKQARRRRSGSNGLTVATRAASREERAYLLPSQRPIAGCDAARRARAVPPSMQAAATPTDVGAAARARASSQGPNSADHERFAQGLLDPSVDVFGTVSVDQSPHQNALAICKVHKPPWLRLPPK